MNLEAYDVESLRQIVRDLQNENEALRAQLHRQNIPAAESMAFHSCRKEDLYDPDQGARIEHPTITREMLSLFYKWFHGRPDVYARRGKKGGYYPQCANRWSEKCPFQNGSSRYCLKNQCPVREWIPLTGKVILSHLLGKSKFGDDAIGVYPLFDDDTCHFLVFDFDHHKDKAERGDGANEKDLVKNVAKSTELGFEITLHDKMPDVVLYREDKDWLYFVESVTSVGPMDPKRILEITEMTKNVTAGKIFVTAFLEFKTYKRFWRIWHGRLRSGSRRCRSI